MSATTTAERRRLMVGDPIPAVVKPEELRALLDMDRTTFWQLEKRGAFDALRTKLPGRRTYAGAKVARLIEGVADLAETSEATKQLARHFLTTARRRRQGR